MRGKGGVAGEGRVVGVPKFHFWGMCTLLLMNLNSTQIGCPTLPLACLLFIYITQVLYFPSWGVINCGCGVNFLHKNVCSSCLTIITPRPSLPHV